MTRRRHNRIDPAQPELDFEFGLPAGREVFSVTFLARHFCYARQHWINLIDRGHIPAVNLATPGVTKSSYRISRADLVHFLRTRHTHTPPENL